MMPFDALAQMTHSRAAAIFWGWVLVLAVAGIIILGFRRLNDAGITPSERTRLQIAGTGYWGTH